MCLLVQFVAVQLLSHVWLFVTPWTEARQASLPFTISWSLLKFMSIESVMPSNHLILRCPLLLFPSISILTNESVLCIRLRQSIGASASASVLPINIQDWFPLGLTSWISLQSRGLSRVFSNTTVQKHQFFGECVGHGKIVCKQWELINTNSWNSANLEKTFLLEVWEYRANTSTFCI